MTARDRWTEDLECPQCGLKGTAEVSQADGYAFLRNPETTVDYLPAGFRPVVEAANVEGLSGMPVTNFYCKACDVRA